MGRNRRDEQGEEEKEKEEDKEEETAECKGNEETERQIEME